MDKLTIECETGKASDGYHTFDELYEHRHTLYITLCKSIQRPKYSGDQRNNFGDEKIVWRSKKHSDGTMYGGWFIMGINKDQGRQISYHLPLSKWDQTEFADTLSNAPKWDGHTAQDVIKRLAEWFKQ